MTPTPDTTTQDNNSSVVMTSPPSAMPVPSAEERAATADGGKGGEGIAIAENPYLAGLAKKTRGLKKKLEKIRKTESLSKSGKHLNEEQLKLLETKPLLEVALSEHERVRGVIEAVARDQAEQQAAQQAQEEQERQSGAGVVANTAPLASTSNPALPTPALSIPVTAAPTATGGALSILSIPATDLTSSPVERTALPPSTTEHESQGDGQISEEQRAPPATTPATPSMQSVGVVTDVPESGDAGAQTDVSGPLPQPGLDPREVAVAMAAAAEAAAEEQRKVEEAAEARGLAAGRTKSAAGVAKLLRLLHVASRFEAKGERLPSAVDFFSKVLLGKTVPPDEADFDGCLDQSVERAVLYLDPLSSTREVAPGVNFQRLEEIVATLREQIVTAPAPAQSPVFNFFGDASPPRPAQGECGSGPTDQRDNANSRDVASGLPLNGEDQASTLSTPAPTAGVVAQDVSHFQASSTPGSGDEQAMVLPLPGPLPGPPPQPMVGASAASSAPAPVPPPQGVRTEEGSVQPSNAAGQRERHHERQASEMEEGVLPPVVSHAQLPPPPPPTSNARSALPQREQRLAKPRSRPVQGYPQAPPPDATGHYAPQPQHPGLPSPPLPHPLHVRSPFQQQSTPPLTPGRPTGAPPPAVAPGGSPNERYNKRYNERYNNGGWGYGQPPPPPPPQAALLPQQLQHQQQRYQQHTNMLQMPPAPVPMPPHQDRSAVGPLWGDNSPPMYPTALSTARSTASPPQAGDSNRVQETLAGGFSLARENVQGTTTNASRVQQQRPPPPPPAGIPPPPAGIPPPPAGIPPSAVTTAPAASTPAQSTMRPPEQWTQANGTTVGPPLPALQQETNMLDLERGMTSPWQGLPQDAGAAAAAVAGGGAAPSVSGGVTMNGPGLGADANASGQPGVMFASDGGQQQQQSSPAFSSNASPSPVQESPPESTSNAKENTSISAGSTDVANGTASAAADASDSTGAAKPRGGNARGRGSGPRARGRGRGEPRPDGGNNTTTGQGGRGGDDHSSKQQQPAPGASERAVVTTVVQQPPQPPSQQQQQQQAPKQSQPQRRDQSQRSAKPQRRPREQGRAQPQKREQQPSRSPDQQQQQQTAQGGGQKRNSSPTQQPQRTSTSQQYKGRANPNHNGNNAQAPRQAKNQTLAPSVHVSKNGWSNGNGGAPAASLPPVAQPTPPVAQPRALLTTSWADDDEPSPAPIQRTVGSGGGGGGGRRSRQTSHQKSMSSNDGQRSQQATQQSQGYASVSSHDHGARPSTQRQGGSGNRGNGAMDGGGGGGGWGGSGGAGSSKPRGQQSQFHGRGGTSEGQSQNRGGQPNDTVPSRSKGQDGGNVRMSNGNVNVNVNGGAPQSAGPRKNRAPSANRRRGGGGGRGSQQQRQQQGTAQRST